MQRVVIHLCSPLLCQRSWLQRQLLKDGMILVTICVGIVSVQHQVPTTSLSLGIVMKAELSYRLLVTLLFASEQQWGTHSSRARPATISFPISFTSACYSVVAQDGFSSKVLNDYSSLYEKPSTSSFKFTYDTETSFVCWIAIGK